MRARIGRAVIGAVLVTMAITGCSTPAPPAGAVTSSTATPTVAPSAPAVEVPRTAATLGPAAPVIAPVRVRIDASGIDVPVVPVGLYNDGFMELPDDPAVAGWYRFGPAPATGAGNTVISAHIDAPAYPIGPFSKLRDVPAGTEVTVESADGSITRYATETVTFYVKAQLPTEQLFARDGAPALVLITCGGDFDRTTGHYSDNVVLVARRVG